MPALISISDACVTWLRKHNAKLADSTARAYRGEVDRFGQFLSSEHKVQFISAIQVIHWNAYLAAIEKDRRWVKNRRRKQLKPGSLMQARRITASFLRWCSSCGLIRWQVPAQGIGVLTPRVPVLNANPRMSQHLQESLAYALSSAPPEGSDRDSLRSLMVLNLSYWGALKTSEIAQLKVVDLIWRTENDACVLAVLRSYARDSERFLNFPAHVGKIWSMYAATRSEAIGTQLPDHAPVIASELQESALSNWSIWAILKRWQKASHLPEDELTPRLLRQVAIAKTQSEINPSLLRISALTNTKYVDWLNA